MITPMDILGALRGRKSVRAFLDRPVAPELIDSVLEAARWAPSATNSQPWEVVVVAGAARARLSEAILAARKAGEKERPDYRIYPVEWVEPYKSRRKACGLAMYKALGISREDKDRAMKAWELNYSFFGAPAGLLFFLDRGLGQGAWLDMGMFIQSVSLAALTYGLGTCAQAALAEYPDIVRREVGVPDSRLLVCGMALGYPDPAAPVNGYRTERAPVSVFARTIQS